MTLAEKLRAAANQALYSEAEAYATLEYKAVREQRTFDFGDRDALIDCFCGDAA